MAAISGYDSSSLSILFSSINNQQRSSGASFMGGGMLGINFSDYASIRSGSYHKLLKAYYSDSMSDEVKNAVSNSTSISKDDTKTLARIEDASETLQSSAEALQATGSKSVFEKVNGEDYDREAIYNAVNKFVEDYNTMLDQAADSNTRSILRAANTMVNYSKVNERLLAKAGITIDADNQLSVDKEKLNNANITDLKTLFQTRGSYGYQIQTQASLIEAYAKNEAVKANTYGSKGVYTYNYNTGELYNSVI